MAIAIRGGGSVAGVVFHPDQGGEYTGRIFAQACLAHTIQRTGRA
jgi:putative transposase